MPKFPVYSDYQVNIYLSSFWILFYSTGTNDEIFLFYLQSTKPAQIKKQRILVLDLRPGMCGGCTWHIGFFTNVKLVLSLWLNLFGKEAHLKYLGMILKTNMEQMEWSQSRGYICNRDSI